MDWAELNPDLLHIIANKLYGLDVSNSIRFRSVCKKWRSVAVPSNPAPQLPWFIETTMHNKGARSFYSLYSNKTHTISIPEAYQKFIEGPSKHYLLAMGFDVSNWVYSSALLINPITKTQIPVPLKDVSYCIPIYLGPPPTNDVVYHDVLAVFLLYSRKSSWTLAVWQSNDEIWTRVRVPMGMNAMGYYYKGRVFATCVGIEETLVIDISTGCVLERIPNPKQNICFHYIIEGAGDLHGVIKRFDLGEQRLIGFEVYRLEDSGKSVRWSMVSGIGDLMMFLDDDRNGFCVSASDFDGFNGNCIYFIRSYMRDDHEICRYDMEEGKEEVIVSLPNDFKGTWFVPSLV